MLHFNYILFDAARAERNLDKAMELNPGYQSLYKGWAEDDLEGVAPYLFTANEETEFMQWFLEYGWGQSWGTLVFANVAFDDLYKHFRKFLMVKTEDGRQLYFRFYDPRVLRIFLPTCDSQQIKEIFGPVRHFITEGEEQGTAIRFWHENYQLKSQVVSINESSAAPIALETEKEVEIVVQQKEQAPQTIAVETSISKDKKKWKFDID